MEQNQRTVQHHVKYKELHGEDKVVFLTYSEHNSLHARLRKEGKCKIPVPILRKISNRACGRTEIGKALKKKHNNRPEVKALKAEYRRRAEKRFEDCCTIGKNVLLSETIILNILNNELYFSSRFIGNHKKVLPIVEI